MGEEAHRAAAFSFAGLLRLSADSQIVAKPALAAFHHSALALEHCRKKGHKATSCIR